MTFPAQDFTTGQVLTAAQMDEISTEINDLWRFTPRSVSATSDTLVLTDSYNRLVSYSNTGTTTITIPNSSSVAFTTGAIVNILKTGATGTVSIIQGSGVTISSAGSTSTNPTITEVQGLAQIIKTGGDSFIVAGDINKTVASGGGDLVKINSTNFSAVASQQIDSVFSSTYDHYRIYVRLTACSIADADLSIRLRVGSDIAGDSTDSIRQDNTSISGVESATVALIGKSSTTYPELTQCVVDLSAPNLAVRTTGNTNGMWTTNTGSPTQFRGSFYWNVATQFTGLTLYTSSGTISGNIQIYGLKA